MGELAGGKAYFNLNWVAWRRHRYSFFDGSSMHFSGCIWGDFKLSRPFCADKKKGCLKLKLEGQNCHHLGVCLVLDVLVWTSHRGVSSLVGSAQSLAREPQVLKSSAQSSQAFWKLEKARWIIFWLDIFKRLKLSL